MIGDSIRNHGWITSEGALSVEFILKGRVRKTYAKKQKRKQDLTGSETFNRSMDVPEV